MAVSGLVFCSHSLFIVRSISNSYLIGDLHKDRVVIVDVLDLQENRNLDRSSWRSVIHCTDCEVQPMDLFIIHCSTCNYFSCGKTDEMGWDGTG